MIRDKYPEKEFLCRHYLRKENWTALDVLEVNRLLFESRKIKDTSLNEATHRAYDSQSIKQILIYQQKNKLNNNQIAYQYGISRNTIAKWKRLFKKDTED